MSPQIEGETPAESDASGETPNGDAAQDAENVRQDDSPLAVTGLLKKLLRFDFDGAVRQSLRNAARDAALAAVRDAAWQRGEDARVRAVLFGAHAAAPLSDRRH